MFERQPCTINSIFQEINIRLNVQEDIVTLTVTLNKTLPRLHVQIFFAVLDLEFNQERSEVLRKGPPLDMESCYAYIRKDQNQRKPMEKPKDESDHVVHLATRNRNKKEKTTNGKRNTFMCTHYGEEGHSKIQCYEIIG